MHGLSDNTGFSLWGNQNVYKTGNYWRMLSLYWMAFCTARKECEGRLRFAIPFSFYHGFRHLHGWTMFIDVEHPHLRLSLKMKLSWCPGGGKVKRRCSRNHRVGKSASVLVALWLFKSSFPPASWGLWLYEHCATFGRSLNIYLPYVIDNRATGASDETTWELDGQHLEQTGQQLWTKWTSLMHCLEGLGGNLEATWRQLWDNRSETSLTQLWDNFQTTLRYLWDNFQTSWRKFLTYFEKALVQLWDNFETTFSPRPHSDY